MKFSEFFASTLRNPPKDAESKIHRLLLKSGMIKQVAAGIYDFLPLGLRVLKNIEKVIREEMVAINCHEVLLPLLTPSELWKETGRWDSYGKELFRVKDRNNREFCIAPTHEEIITDLAREFIKSYRDLPKSLFQIGQKFRDEPRPRFGITRAREFIMKDAYSFDPDDESAELTYRKFYSAYMKIFERLKLDFMSVEAAVGLIGGKFSHEFISPSEIGEDIIIECTHCGYVSKKEIAECIIPDNKITKKGLRAKEKIYTPSTTTVESLAKFLGVQKSEIIKSLFIKTKSDRKILVLVRGDHEISEDKLAVYLQDQFELADELEVRSIFGAGKGFIGPLNLDLKNIDIISDGSILQLEDGICGADEDDWHFRFVVPGRDFPIDKVGDLRLAKENDVCNRCKIGIYKEKKGLEIGHTFFLGTKYSEPMRLNYLTKSGEEKPVIMGCYGIGVTRLVSAIIEQNSDEKSIFFPKICSPFFVHIIPINIREDKIKNGAEHLHSILTKHYGNEIILIDDRDESPGVKFNDADLFGAPIRIIVGRNFKDKELVEVISRSKKETKTSLFHIEQVPDYIDNLSSNSA